LDVVARRFELQDEIGNTDLSAGCDYVQQTTLLLDMFEILSLRLAFNQEIDSAANHRQNHDSEEEHKGKDSSARFEIAFASSCKDPTSDAQAYDRARANKQDSN
jgi:hypothetical protein